MRNNTRTPEGYAPFDLYPYNPSQGPAYAFLGLFGAAGIAHFIMMFPYRSAFPIPMIIGCGMEATAYWFRSRSHNNLRQTLPFLIQNLLVLVAPPFLAATIYMSLGRITRALKAQEVSLISLRWITKLFVLVDLICFVTQTAGAIMSGSEDVDEAKRGQTIIIGGLVLQILAFALFIICTLTLQLRIRASPPVHCVAGVIAHYRRYFIALYCTSGLFFVRNVCDEVKPQCGKCVQFGVWCDFSPLPPGPQPSLSSQPDNQSRRPGRPRSDWTSWAEQIRVHAAESATPTLSTNMMDLELFHTYMTRTASTLGGGSGSGTLLWSEAFHVARIKPVDEQRYSLIAETHLTAALQPAMILISNLGGDNGPAAYLTSVLICFIALAKDPSPGNLLLANIEGQVSWLHLLRGVRLVVESAGWSSIFSGTLAQYAPLPSGDTLEHTAATNPNLMADGIEDWRSSLNRISNLIAQLAEENMDNVYDRELEALTACFERTFCRGQDAALDTVGRLQDVIGWVYRLGDD
ncbi:related to Rtm1p [Fusarium proliferatum]|nr:related to Rtm1p [Fusarium proliferatum]